jgi:hypothetical protein
MTSFPVRECGDGFGELEEDFALHFPAPNTLTARNAASLPVFNDETAENISFS